MIYKIDKTVFCFIVVQDELGNLQNPSTMNVRIDRLPQVATVLEPTEMNSGSEGLYYYDYDSSDTARGDYRVTYEAIEGSRITTETDTFTLE